MKKLLFLFAVIAVILVGGVIPAYAHGGGFRGSIWIGPGWGPWGPWWGAPYYYAAPPVIIERQPPVVYEQQAPPAQEQQYYWYFCPDSKTYYPYVKECPGGWMKVVPPDKGR